MCGFEGAPRVVGAGFDEKGREKLSFIEGEFIHPAPWDDEALVALGKMVRRLHDATASFSAPDNAIWREWFGRSLGKSDIIGHCDIAPWNTVMRDGLPYALIDWEVAGPVSRLTEVAMLAWNSVQLYDDDIAERNKLAGVEDRFRQVRLLVDAYGLPAPERGELAGRIIELAVYSAANEAIEHGITPDTTDCTGMWGVVWRARSAAWLLRHRAELEKALA